MHVGTNPGVRASIPVTLLMLLIALTAGLSTADASTVGWGDVRVPGYQGLAAAGSDVLCGIRADDTLHCWGRTTIAVAAPPGGTFEAVSAARRVACGLRSDATLTCWGRWYSDVHHASRVEAPAGRYAVVDLAEEQGCALATDGRVTCFGRFSEADAGTGAGVSPIDGTFIDVAAVHDDYGGCAIRTDSTIACWGDDTWGQASPPEGTFIDLAAGRMTYCAIRTSGELACWGRGLYGAAEPPAGRYTAVAIGGDTGCAISELDRSPACWGADLGAPPDVPAAAIAIGDTIAGLIGTNGVLHTWGETRLWPAWGGFGDPGRRDGFHAFRIVGKAPTHLEQGVPIDIGFATTPIEPRPEFRVAAGQLPPGLELTTEGRLVGTPTASGAFGPLTLVADNGMAPLDALAITLTVLPAGLDG